MDFDYDLISISVGIGGHGSTLHAFEKDLKIAF